MPTTTIDDVLEPLPEVQAGKGLWQNRFHEFDVYTHTIEFVSYVRGLTDDPHIIAAGYLHDIGKPVVAKPIEKGGIVEEKEPGKQYHTFGNHENVGAEMVRKMGPSIFHELGLDQERVADLVGCHYIPMNGIKEMRKAATYAGFEAEYRRLEATLDECPVSREEVLTMFLADKLAQGKFCTDKKELFAIRDTLLDRNSDIHAIYDLQKEMYGEKE